MADSNANQQLDKISYGLGGVLAVVIIALPFVTGDVSESKGKAINAVEALTQLVQDQKIAPAAAPNTQTTIADQWTVGAAEASDPGWVTEIAPALLRSWKKEPPKAPIHDPPVLEELSCGRDGEAQSPFILVKGTSQATKEKHVRCTALELYRKEDDGGFLKVDEATVESPVGNAFEYQDLQVKSGRTYTYKLVSTVEKHPEAPEAITALDPAERRKESEELGPSEPVPFDFSIVISTIKEENAVPQFYGRIMYWDYAKGELVKPRTGKFYKERERFAGERYEIFPIDKMGKAVGVRDKKTGIKHKIYQKNRKGRPVDVWPPLLAGGAEVEGGTEGVPPESEPAEGKPKEPKEPEAPKEPPPKTTRPRKSRFG